jgi:phosphoribosylanthranilate isomerase
VPASVKFCGLTRPEDARAAATLGASHVGVIFAGGPRHLSVARAVEVLAGLPTGVRRVGVFGAQSPAEVVDVATAAELDVVQLHGTSDAGQLEAVRRALRATIEVWAVARVAGGELPAALPALWCAADALVVDALVPGRLGGTGVVADWPALAHAFARAGRPGRLVLAGGLRPENVERAVRLLGPDVVDVSSGVEAGPGIKDHARMAAFAAAVARCATDDTTGFTPSKQQTRQQTA